MERITRRADNDIYPKTEDVSLKDAVNRLAMFEDVYDDINNGIGTVNEQTEKLRAEGRTNTVMFRQLFTKKLLYAEILSIFEKHGIK